LLIKILSDASAQVQVNSPQMFASLECALIIAANREIQSIYRLHDRWNRIKLLDQLLQSMGLSLQKHQGLSSASPYSFHCGIIVVGQFNTNEFASNFSISPSLNQAGILTDHPLFAGAVTLSEIYNQQKVEV
jgi:hypothetical protein